MANRIIIFLDRIAPKNKLQIMAIHKMNMEADFFLIHENSHTEYLKDSEVYTILKATFFKRLKQVFQYFKKHYKDLHHAEIYPAGRFSFIYLVIAKMFCVKTVCVERGDIQYFERNQLNKMEQFSMWVCYKFSDVVWYREYYMKEILERLKVKKLFFAHNAIEYNTETPNYKKDIDFLWLNRVIAERKADWFIDVLKNPELKDSHNYLVGLTKKTDFEKEQNFVLENKIPNLTILPYTGDAASFYKRSRFFVLPADIVFVNNSLIEAMNYGVVPIVSNVSGASEIVTDSVNGILFEHNPQSFENAIKKALALSEEKYIQLSVAARTAIKEKFSEMEYFKQIEELYRLLD